MSKVYTRYREFPTLIYTSIVISDLRVKLCQLLAVGIEKDVEPQEELDDLFRQGIIPRAIRRILNSYNNLRGAVNN